MQPKNKNTSISKKSLELESRKAPDNSSSSSASKMIRIGNKFLLLHMHISRIDIHLIRSIILAHIRTSSVSST
ncbi:hypothetical protein CICLE_v10023186mg [Citrus x clementina]|uniref:Uncharacterized protein n=1 Tax=Citrus clementina TaxID=85681 RepID=V4TKC9_CITCL|nr:hypothetical protein CICLE_v10023186mg [Citrus x clementina]